MTDFNKFKKMMLERKAALTKEKALDKADDGDKMDFSKDTAEFFWQMYGMDHTDKKSGWKKRTEFKCDKRKVTGSVYSRKFDGYPIEWTRCEAVYEDATMK